jgi:hypothetical protein
MVRAILAALAAVPLLAGAARCQSTAVAAAVLTRQVFAAESSFARRNLLRGEVGDARQDGGGGRLARAVRRPGCTLLLETGEVEVLASGTLAHSSGPVHDAKGRQIGNFNSIWRREPDGTWLVVFDKGCPVCNCERGP